MGDAPTHRVVAGNYNPETKRYDFELGAGWPRRDNKEGTSIKLDLEAAKAFLERSPSPYITLLPVRQKTNQKPQPR